jgi:UDP-GlcNAc:undecaprenyl-phosphate GlcNAc-1-phosphate transferase
MQTLLGFVLAMSITMVLIPLLMRWAEPLGIIDHPEARKVHTRPVPRVGGIAMAVAVLVALVPLSVVSRAVQAMMLGIVILSCVGVWDDRRNLSATAKFAAQTVAVAVIMLWGGISITTLTGVERLALPQALAVPLTFLFLVGSTNAFNLADGLDGLAGGMAMLCLSGTALLAFTVGNAGVGTAAVILIGAVIGFLRFNTHPARVFMGDTGSLVLGFCAATLAILLTQDPKIPLSTALPLLLLGVPVIDTLMVMIERIVEGRSPFRADRCHIHHRLLAVGFRHWEAVSLLYLMQGGLFVAAWYLRYADDTLVASVFLVSALTLVVPLRLAQHFGLQLRRPESKPEGLDPSRRAIPEIPRSLASALLGGTLAFYAGWVLVRCARPSLDLRVLAVALGLVLLGSLLVRRRHRDLGWPEKAALYASAALALWLTKHDSPDGAHLPLLECVLFPLLAVAVVVNIRTAKELPFRVTPLDILILLAVAIVPNLPGSIVSGQSLGPAVAELVLLVYALEALSIAAAHRWRWLSGAAVAFLFGLALRAPF